MSDPMNGRFGGLVPAEELDRGVRQGLRGLRVQAPEGLAAGALERVGLADAYLTIDTAIGPVLVAYNGRGVSASAPADDPQGFEERFRLRFGRPIRRAAAPPPKLVTQLTRWLEPGRGRRPAGRPPAFDLRTITPFHQAVLAKMLEIPRGQVRTYGWVAREVGRPRAVRAVGTALARNPVPLLIPCHRAIRADGSIEGYAWGTPVKRQLLTVEGVDVEELLRLGRRGVRYVGSDTTRIFCFPTCHNARRISDRHRVGFEDPAAAAAAGYRPCRECRPLEVV